MLIFSICRFGPNVYLEASVFPYQPILSCVALIDTKVQGWRDGSGFNSPCCPCRVSGFFQFPVLHGWLTSLQLQGIQHFSSPKALDMHYVSIHTYKMINTKVHTSPSPGNCFLTSFKVQTEHEYSRQTTLIRRSLKLQQDPKVSWTQRGSVLILLVCLSVTIHLNCQLETQNHPRDGPLARHKGII